MVQFKVLREGCWKKLNFEKPDIHPKSRVDGSFGFVTSPWIQHFRPPKVEEAQSPSKHCQPQTNINVDGKNTATFLSPPTKLRQPLSNQLCCEVVLGDNTEFSDQNFGNEDSDQKRRQSTGNAAEQITNSWSNSDQVVPSRIRGSSDE